MGRTRKWEDKNSARIGYNESLPNLLPFVSYWLNMMQPRCVRTTTLHTLTALYIWCAVAHFGLAQAPAVDFQRDIQPLLAEKCLHCHGADAATRQAGLRLDDADAALKGGESGQAIQAGNSKQSLLIERINSSDPDLVMPPPKEGKPLSPRERSKHWLIGSIKVPSTPSTGRSKRPKSYHFLAQRYAARSCIRSMLGCKPASRSRI